MNLDNQKEAQPTVQVSREITTTNGCKVTLMFAEKEDPYLEFAPQLPQNQAIADNRSIEQRICIKPAKRSRQRDLSLLVRFMQRRATPITQKDVSRR